ncbi:ATP-binding protein [Actinomadura sp. NBRC 104412]|uniref:ATP-binding protein n=1 Tax=Actinomadura sp. NBRC 104412 TaxID=3032203 RepID=UPI002555EE91|nr:ATP-binding protein [Actinomadura sp. NBRC 104412]
MIDDIEWSALPVASLPRSWRILLDSRLRRIGIPAGVTDDVVLATCELVTNAVEHSPSDAPITLRVRFGVGRLWVGVWDASDEPPVRQPEPTLDGDLDDILTTLAENGRGLQIITALASDRNVDWTPPQGKWTWARFHF